MQTHGRGNVVLVDEAGYGGGMGMWETMANGRVPSVEKCTYKSGILWINGA